MKWQLFNLNILTFKWRCQCLNDQHISHYNQFHLLEQLDLTSKEIPKFLLTGGKRRSSIEFLFILREIWVVRLSTKPEEEALKDLDHKMEVGFDQRWWLDRAVVQLSAARDCTRIEYLQKNKKKFFPSFVSSFSKRKIGLSKKKVPISKQHWRNTNNPCKAHPWLSR